MLSSQLFLFLTLSKLWLFAKDLHRICLWSPLWVSWFHPRNTLADLHIQVSDSKLILNVCKCVCVWTWIHVCVWTWMHVCVCVCGCECLWVCVCVWPWMDMSVCVWMWMRVCVCKEVVTQWSCDQHKGSHIHIFNWFIFPLLHVYLILSLAVWSEFHFIVLFVCQTNNQRQEINE